MNHIKFYALDSVAMQISSARKRADQMSQFTAGLCAGRDRSPARSNSEKESISQIEKDPE